MTKAEDPIKLEMALYDYCKIIIIIKIVHNIWSHLFESKTLDNLKINADISDGNGYAEKLLGDGGM